MDYDVLFNKISGMPTKLGRIQIISIGAKAVTTVLGIVQSIIIIRLFSPAEYGLVGLVMSIGGVVGVSQHLGIVDGAIREIAVLDKKREIGKVFWVSHLVRQMVTIPLSVGLLLAAGLIAGKVYGRPEIQTFLQVFTGVLVLQGLQDVMGATLTGMKKFVELYVVQIITAAINVAVFGWMVWQFGVAGFFWAIILTTTLMVVLLFIVIMRMLRENLELPNWTDIKKYGWRVMRIGAYMYAARIFFIIWQRLPILMLGGVLSADQLGYLNVSQTFGSKLTIIAMALSEVNLSWMSSLYTKQRDEFAKVVTRNMQRVLVLMMGIALLLLFFIPEILNYVIGTEYLAAHKIILVMTLGFFLYTLIDIGTSSVFVPADAPRLRAYTYMSMTGVTGIIMLGLLFLNPNPLLSAWAVLAGAVIGYVLMVVITKVKFGVSVLTKQLMLFLTLLAGSFGWLLLDPSFASRLIIFVLLGGFVWWQARKSQLIPSVRELKSASRSKEIKFGATKQIGIVCFAGAEYRSNTWTNRQNVMSRISRRRPVLYVEPRVWIVKYIGRNIARPVKLASYAKRLFWREKINDNLWVKSQFNLIPGSRELKGIAKINHLLNRFNILGWAALLGFKPGERIMWIYDTEAAEFLSAFKNDNVVYDCVDDHAAQAGVDRNAKRVEEEEERIMARADLITVISRRLLKSKSRAGRNVQLVLNAGSTKLFRRASNICPKELSTINRPIIGSVGALDAYKVDFELLYRVAQKKSDWNFVFIGAPVVDRKKKLLRKFARLPNVHLLGTIAIAQVPQYVHCFDVCLIPYRASKYNAASFPLKFWEFMATGKPMVVTGVPELREYNKLIGYAKGERDFIGDIEDSLKAPDKGRNERIKEASQHDWDNRVAKLLKLINELSE